MTEGGVLVFDITLTGDTTAPVVVDYTTADGSATAGDYVARSGQVTLSNSARTASVSVPTVLDATCELDETVNLNLSSTSSEVTIGAHGIGTITDKRTVTIDDPSAAEGDAGTKVVPFTVTLSGPACETTQVVWSPGGGTATPGTDFTIPPGGTLTFAVGDTTKTIPVTINGDRVYEPDETYSVNLTSYTGAEAISKSVGVGTILNDDAAPPPPPTTPVVSIADVTVSEAAGTALLEVKLDQPSSSPVSLNVRTIDGTAKAPADYEAIYTQLTFAPGDTSKNLPIPIVSDSLDEPDETFTVEMFNVSGATAPKPKATVTITDLPVLRISDILVDEGAGAAVLTVTLSGTKSTQPIKVDYRTVEDTYKAATAGADFTAVAGTLEFLPGETTKTISIPIVNDTIPEVDETFSVLLEKPVGARIAKSKGQVTIADNDTAPWSGPPTKPTPPPFKPVTPISTPAATPTTPPKKTPVTKPTPKAKTVQRKLQASLLSTRIALIKGRRRAAIRISLSEPVTARIVMLQGKRKLSSAPFKLLGGKRTVFVFLPAYVKTGKVQLQLLVTTTQGLARTLKTTVLLKPPVKPKLAKPKPKPVKPKPL